MKRKFSIVALMLILTLALTACGGKKTETPATEDPATETGSEETTETASELKVAMVTDEGGVNDQSFNQSAWEGLQRAEEEIEGVKSSYQESTQTADYEPNFETLLDAGNNLIWGVGYKLADATESAALDNPDVKFGIVDYAYEQVPENLVSILFKDEQSSFLVGYIAGKTTETNKVGFVGGIEGDVIKAFESGYKAGVLYAAKEDGKEIEIMVQYAASFTDSAKGKAIAQNMYQQGADVVFHAAGGVGDGVIEAAKEQGKWAIGVDRDQNDLAPDNVLTSAMKRVDVAVYNVAKDIQEGKFEGGTVVVYGLENDGAVDIAPTSDKNVRPEILEVIPKLKEDIISGTIEVPRTDDTFEEFKSNL